MKVYEFGIDKTIRCYATVESETQIEARTKLAALLAGGPLHLIDPEAGIDYTDRADTAPTFSAASIALVNVEGGSDEDDLAYCDEHDTFTPGCSGCLAANEEAGGSE